MHKKMWLIVLPICVLSAGWIVTRASAGQMTPPIIEVNTHLLGPQRLGPLPPVVPPPGNPPSSLKIHLGKELYFDARLSADGMVSCASEAGRPRSSRIFPIDRDAVPSENVGRPR